MPLEAPKSVPDSELRDSLSAEPSIYLPDISPEDTHSAPYHEPSDSPSGNVLPLPPDYTS